MRGRPRDILGETIRINGDLVTIVGVAGEGFTGSSVLVAPELWLPPRAVWLDHVRHPGQCQSVARRPGQSHADS